MNVLCQLTIVIETQPAPTMVDLFFALARVDILEMELFAKVCAVVVDVMFNKRVGVFYHNIKHDA
jgi:hypothetical protein